MQIIAIILATATAAAISIAYIRNASAGSKGQPIPLIFVRLSHVPLWVDLVCYPAWLASALILAFTLPSWAAMTIYCLAAVLPWELMRRRHNRRIKTSTPA
ncbi:hypothetical protein OG756_12865 [Streptomyces sp. NBC_01310]|uniref:hypothetical protein n=1 Tax=Streptomyces sp. NBC_01310 TaxID=2903820 RepID=UPI0035B69A56|nr:hypothetical protein OG756_12865 [Streptomyces sp. NBC_01310]